MFYGVGGSGTRDRYKLWFGELPRRRNTHNPFKANLFLPQVEITRSEQTQTAAGCECNSPAGFWPQGMWEKLHTQHFYSITVLFKLVTLKGIRGSYFSQKCTFKVSSFDCLHPHKKKTEPTIIVTK